MPREGVTIYDLLISCPGDVTGYLQLIKEAVDNFNKLYGSLNNIQVSIKHWSTDSFPESGDKPQELLLGNVMQLLLYFGQDLVQQQIIMDQERKKKLRRCYQLINKFLCTF